MNEEDAFNESTTTEGPVKAGGSDIPGENEAMDVPMRPEEKRRLSWDNGIYLAPLTTVGNLVSHLFFRLRIPIPPFPFPGLDIQHPSLHISR
jgi:tRNA-dihydrouridine synthase 3